MKIICIGNAAYDVTLPVNHYPVENKKIRLDAQNIIHATKPRQIQVLNMENQISDKPAEQKIEYLSDCG